MIDMEEHERLYADGSVKEARRALLRADTAVELSAAPVADVPVAQVRAILGVGYALLAIARSLDALVLVVRERGAE